MADISPRQHEISSKDRVLVRSRTDSRLFILYKPLMLSLASNGDLKSLLTSFSTRLIDRYLVTEIVQCPADPRLPYSNITTPLYSVAKPFVWHRTSVKIHFAYSPYSFSDFDDESACSASYEQSDDELRSEG